MSGGTSTTLLFFYRTQHRAELPIFSSVATDDLMDLMEELLGKAENALPSEWRLTAAEAFLSSALRGSYE